LPGDHRWARAGDAQSGTSQPERTRAGSALDAANFFLADVRDGLGPYLAIYLLNMAQGAIITALGIGATLSTALAGFVVARPS
jgi:hypothetical protein